MNPSLEHEWHIPNVYITKEICPIISLDVKYSAISEIYKSVGFKNKAYSIYTHNLCCRPLLLYFYEPFVSSFPSFLLPFSSLPSFSPSLRFPNDFLAFHFFPCPNPATEARMQLKSLFCLNRIVFTLDPLLHHLGPVDEFRCLILSHEATPSPLNTSIAFSNYTLFPQTDPLPSLMCLILDSLFTFIFISLLEQQKMICVWLNLK